MRMLQLLLFWMFSFTHDEKVGESDYKDASSRTVWMFTIYQFVFFDYLALIFNTLNLAAYNRLPIMLRYLCLSIPLIALYNINYYLILNKGQVVLDAYFKYKDGSFWLTKSRWSFAIISVIYVMILLFSARWIHVNYH